MKKAIIFDCDMTLVDTSIGTHHCVNKALKALGYESVDYGKVKSTIGIYMTESFKILTGEDNVQQAERFRDLFLEGESQINEYAKLFEGVLPVLHFAKRNNLCVGIVTSKHRDALEDIFNRFALKDLFDCSITGDEVKVQKPAPDGLNEIMKRMNVSACEVIYVGDSFVDAQAACSAGVNFIPVLSGATDISEFENYPRVAVAQDMHALLDILQQYGK
jgi:phosphoglycolate phosphatase